MATKQHFYEIDVVKGIAILFVLWHHSFILYPINMLDIPWCQYAMAIHGTFYLNVFFLISGYLYANSTQRSFLDNFKKKASRLLIPYFSYAVINLIVGWQWVLKDYYNELMVKISAETGKKVDLPIYESDLLAFGVTNMINAIIAFLIFSYIIKWWSSNCSRAPF